MNGFFLPPSCAQVHNSPLDGGGGVAHIYPVFLPWYLSTNVVCQNIDVQSWKKINQKADILPITSVKTKLIPESWYSVHYWRYAATADTLPIHCWWYLYQKADILPITADICQKADIIEDTNTRKLIVCPSLQIYARKLTSSLKIYIYIYIPENW